MGKRWTKEEDGILRRDWHRLTREDLANSFNRSVAATATRASALGLSNKTWSEEELQELEVLLPKRDIFEISEWLNRSPDAVRNKARSLGLKGRKERKDELQRTGRLVYCATCGKRFYLPTCQIKTSNYCSPSCCAKSQENKKRLENARAIMCGMNKKAPNRPERKLGKLLRRNFSGKYAFNGNFSCGVMLGGLVPDFVNVNGKKQVIELFGDYWHDKKQNIPWKATEFGRQAVYSQLGFELLIIWEHELKSTREVVEKIRRFNDG